MRDIIVICVFFLFLFSSFTLKNDWFITCCIHLSLFTYFYFSFLFFCILSRTEHKIIILSFEQNWMTLYFFYMTGMKLEIQGKNRNNHIRMLYNLFLIALHLLLIFKPLQFLYLARSSFGEFSIYISLLTRSIRSLWFPGIIGK